MLIPITGAAYTHASQDVNSQRCVNMFPTEIGPNGLGTDDPNNQDNQMGSSKGALIRSPGLGLLIDLGGYELRGLFTINNTYVYVVVDNNVYQLTINTVDLTISSLLIGQISTFTGPVKMRNNLNQLIIVDGTANGYIYMSKTYGTCTLGPIGGTAGDTYTLTINGTAIYTAQAVTTALTAAQLIAKINLSTGTTGITAASGGTGIVTLTSTGPTTITVAESGTGFTAGTDGLTVTAGDFATGSIAAYAKISSSNYLGGNTVVYNDGYFLYNQPGTSYVWCSGLQAGSQWNALAYFTAASKPCIVKGLAVNKGEIWVFADTLVEVWYDAANASPASPYSYRIGSSMDIGCKATNSIVEMELLNVWLDSRGFVCVSNISPYIRNNNSGYDLKVISTQALHAEWAKYETLEDAIATFYVDRGHVMYMITFPTAQKTWVYDFPTKEGNSERGNGGWHERTYLNPQTNREEYYLVQYIANFKGLNIAGGDRGGKVYLLDSRYYTDNGAPIKCTRVTAPFTNDFKNIGIDQIALRMESGAANQNDLGADPQVTLRFSNDGGHTWSDSISRSMGKVGEYNKKITWNRLGTANEWRLEFSVQEPINFSIIKASATVTTMEDL
jgi:hypothetical protein